MKLRVFAFLLLLVAFSSFTTTTKSYENTYAVIIGVADYKYFGATDGDLTYTVNDAKKFRDFLMSDKGGGVPAKNIYLLLDSFATKTDIINLSKQLFSKAGEHDRMIFFFSGHGTKGAFLPFDAGKSYSSYLFFGEVKSIFQASKSRTKLLFADACNSGSLKKNNRSGQGEINKRNLLLDSVDIAIMLSCKESETSLELKAAKQGVFSYFLIHGLEGLADINKDGQITIKELHTYVADKTSVAASKVKGHQQNPITFGQFDTAMVVSELR